MASFDRILLWARRIISVLKSWNLKVQRASMGQKSIGGQWVFSSTKCYWVRDCMSLRSLVHSDLLHRRNAILRRISGWNVPQNHESSRKSRLSRRNSFVHWSAIFDLCFPQRSVSVATVRVTHNQTESSRSTRLGKNGVVEIKAHPFFTNQNEWTWETLRKGCVVFGLVIVVTLYCLAPVPIVPPLTNDEDTSNFDEIEKTDGPTEESFSVSKNFLGNQLSFVGFSFSNEQQ